ncbi:MAG: DegT/DnrJ/EryC1/StrS family aminotransferase [Myxococcota bacterium]|nr:DegT/DnrJ/EryC1/StrS family aminotransferase [Myxococcota bacterium]
MVGWIKLADPEINTADKSAAMAVLDSGTLVNGPAGRAFEAALAAHTGRRHAIAVSSGTTALFAAMHGMGIGPGNRVIVPAFTFPAPAAVAACLGAEVAMCDVDPETFCISCDTLIPLVDDSVSLVVAVDQFGVPAPIPELAAYLDPLGIPVLVDAACSIGSSLDNRPCGGLGHVATFSFHPRKVVATGEGGAVLTDDDALARRVRQFVNHGLEQGVFTGIGINLRLNEIGATIGLSQLGRLGEMIDKRRLLAHQYRQIPLKFQSSPKGSKVNHQTLTVTLPPTQDRSHRDALIYHLREQGIESTLASYCLGAVPAISERLGLHPDVAPVARSLFERSLALPLHGRMALEDVDAVARCVVHWLET